MQFRVLGPLEVLRPSGEPVDLGGPKPRAVLTLLLLDAGSVVPLDRIVDQLWGDEPPASAAGNLQSYVSQLRRALEPDRGPREPARLLLTRPPGYLLVADEDTLDLLRFRRLVEEGERAAAAGNPPAAAASLHQALSLWRGEPLADLADEPSVAAERTRLHELNLRARESYAEALVALGEPARAVDLLQRLVADHPLRERPWSRLVTALYAAGRQADALAAARRVRGLLREELGIEPGLELRAAEQAVLRQDPALVPAPRSALAPSAPVPAASAPAPAASAAAPAAPAASAASVGPAVRPGDVLVGRRTERRRLQRALEEVGDGHGAVVVLEGEAGIGKTRLAEEAAALAAARGWRAVWTRCADDAGAPSLWPWQQVLRQLEDGHDEDCPVVGAAAADPGRDPDERRFALFRALRERLADCAARRPFVVVLDDIQGADATSLQLLRLLAQHLEGLPLLLVLTVRTVGEELSEPVRSCLAALSRERRTVRLALSGLGEGDVRQLVAVTDEEAVDLAGEVHRRTEGNPFFVRELVQLLRSEHRRPGTGADIPPSVRDVLERRLCRLPEDTLALLRLAAVIGRDFRLDVLERAADVAAEEVMERLEPAVASGVVLEDDQLWVWRFSHALVQETVVAGLTRVERARSHHRVAQAWETAWGTGPATDGEVADRLAHHYVRAVPVAGTEPALRWTLRAAAVARDRYGHEEAAGHLRAALGLLDRGGAGAAEQRHEVLVALGGDLLRAGRLREAQDVVGRAIAEARARGDRARLAEAASVWGGVTLWNWRPYGVVDVDLVTLLEDLASTVEHEDLALAARLLGTLGVELAYSTRRDEGIAYAQRGVALARRLGDPVLLGQTLNNYGLAAWGSPEGVHLRLAAADESVSHAGRGLPARTAFFAHLHRGPLRLHLGDADGFREDLRAATTLAVGLSGPEVRPHLLYQEAGLAMLVGDWQRAEELAQEAMTHYRVTDLWGAEACWALHQYTLRRRDGRLDETLDLLVDAGDLGVPLLQALAVLVALACDDAEEAARLRRRWPAQVPHDWTSDAFDVVQAELALLGGGPAGAEDVVGADVAVAYRRLLPCRGRQVVVGTATSVWGPYDALLARLASRLGDQEAARRHAEDAAACGRAVRSPWQVAGAQDLLRAGTIPV